jgi:hypothetical protein
MSQVIAKLLSIASESIADSVNEASALDRWGTRGKELVAMLEKRNGFYAYESALLIRPLRNDEFPLGLLEWNATNLWKGEYKDSLDDVLCFAEDVFGAQYCICGSNICTLDPETGLVEEMSPSLDAWANEVMADFEFRSGYPLAHAWQIAKGPLIPGTRLLPKIPFVCGGKYELENLYAQNDVNGMLFRASIANQIRDLPDGSEISINIQAPSKNDPNARDI